MSGNDTEEGLTTSRLTKSERQDRIVSELKSMPTLRASELASVLGVSNETIRRDLMELDGRGVINRTYGGAARPFAYEAPIGERREYYLAERERIAAGVCDLFREQDVIFIGAGATTYHVARRLAAVKKDMTVVTHDFAVGQALSHNPTIKAIFLPGRIHSAERFVFGAQTLAALEGFNANWSVTGTTGIGRSGVCDADDEAAIIYKAMMRRSANTIVATDHTKFNQTSLSTYASWSAVDYLVVDTSPSQELRRAIDSGGARLHVAT